jgi:hypothetical protein
MEHSKSRTYLISNELALQLNLSPMTSLQSVVSRIIPLDGVQAFVPFSSKIYDVVYIY